MSISPSDDDEVISKSDCTTPVGSGAVATRPILRTFVVGCSEIKSNFFITQNTSDTQDTLTSALLTSIISRQLPTCVSEEEAEGVTRCVSVFSLGNRVTRVMAGDAEMSGGRSIFTCSCADAAAIMCPSQLNPYLPVAGAIIRISVVTNEQLVLQICS